jgi:hypothetical protein
MTDPTSPDKGWPTMTKIINVKLSRYRLAGVKDIGIGLAQSRTDCKSFHGLDCGLKVFFPLKMGWFYTQACMPTYVSILRIPPDDMSLESDGGMTYIGEGKPKKSEKSLPQCDFVHKSHMD